MGRSPIRSLNAILLAGLVAGLAPPPAAAQSFEALAANLGSPSALTRRRAAQDLGKTRHRDAVAPLAGAVRDPDIDVRLAVLRALAEIKDLAGVPAIVVALSDAQPRVRHEAIAAVVTVYTRRDRPSSAGRFLAIFSDERPDPEPLLAAAVDPDVLRALSDRLRDDDSRTREEAAHAIGILGGSDAARELAATLGDASADVRAAAATAIAKVGTAADGEALIPLLDDASGAVRRRAILGLGRLKVEDATAALRRVFDRDRESEEGIAAFFALARITPASEKPLFDRYALEHEPRRRRASIEALGRYGDRGVEKRLKRDFQRERNDELRLAYAFGIFLLGDRAFIDTVVLSLGGSGDRRRQAIAYLTELGARSLPEALDYVAESEPKIRSGLAEAFGAARLGETAAALEKLAQDRDPSVVDAAARALSRIRGRR
jgi:HEAT repeat protein